MQVKKNSKQFLFSRFVDSTAIRKKYRVRDDMDTVLLFNEDSSRPIASISMKEIPSSTLHNVVSSNQYLALPRLSSQVKVDILFFFLIHYVLLF